MLTAVSVVLLLVSSFIMFIDRGSAQGANQWTANWTAEYDNDHGRFFIDLLSSTVERYECNNTSHTGCIRGNLANNDVFSAPPTVVKWTNSGNVNQGGSQFSYTENWVAGDGLGSGVDYRFKPRGYSGNTSGRDHAWAFFTGEARLVNATSGMRLEYRTIFASDENRGAFPDECENINYDPNICDYWLAWGDLPASEISDPPTANSLSNHDFDAHMRRIFGEMDPGMPTKWTVTGSIL